MERDNLLDIQHDDRDDLQDPGATKVMRGGGGNQGRNALDQPYATSAIGSGPEVTAKDTNKIRKGTSFEQNIRRAPDREYNRILDRR